MATRQSTVDLLREQCASAGEVTIRPMFGEYALYLGAKLVGLIADDQLYVKITAPGRGLLDETHDAPPYEGAKPYLKVPVEKWDDTAWLGDLLRVSADALPLPPPKKPKKAKKAKA